MSCLLVKKIIIALFTVKQLSNFTTHPWQVSVKTLIKLCAAGHGVINLQSLFQDSNAFHFNFMIPFVVLRKPAAVSTAFCSTSPKVPSLEIDNYSSDWVAICNNRPNGIGRYHFHHFHRLRQYRLAG